MPSVNALISCIHWVHCLVAFASTQINACDSKRDQKVSSYVILSFCTVTLEQYMTLIVIRYGCMIARSCSSLRCDESQLLLHDGARPFEKAAMKEVCEPF